MEQFGSNFSHQKNKDKQTKKTHTHIYRRTHVEKITAHIYVERGHAKRYINSIDNDNINNKKCTNVDWRGAGHCICFQFGAAYMH